MGAVGDAGGGLLKIPSAKGAPGIRKSDAVERPFRDSPEGTPA